ncbi:MAG TPA: hypothetical protein VM032_15885 [Vicinamibacterales bacterium]|nr:hypothetical protein [Vicinamibacterales bacterium]
MTDDLFDEGPLAETFRGPRSTRGLLRILRRCPPRLASFTLALLALGDGIVRRDRYARALRWAAVQGYRGTAKWRIATALVANHGRFVAQEALLGARTADALRAASTIVGREHLDRLERGGLLIGLHVGPPRSWLLMRAHGVPVCFVLRSTAGEGPRWESWKASGIAVPLPYGDAAQRVSGLYRIRRLLGEGKLLFMAADGPLGREMFRLDVPGGPIIRSGWFELRRQSGVPTLPVLAHEDGARRVVTVYPPLPPVRDDVAEDAAACRAALTPVVSDYVRRYPTQCRYLAFPDWVA